MDEVNYDDLSACTEKIRSQTMSFKGENGFDLSFAIPDSSDVKGTFDMLVDVIIKQKDMISNLESKLNDTIADNAHKFSAMKNWVDSNFKGFVNKNQEIIVNLEGTQKAVKNLLYNVQGHDNDSVFREATADSKESGRFIKSDFNDDGFSNIDALEIEDMKSIEISEWGGNVAIPPSIGASTDEANVAEVAVDRNAEKNIEWKEVTDKPHVNKVKVVANSNFTTEKDEIRAIRRNTAREFYNSIKPHVFPASAKLRWKWAIRKIILTIKVVKFGFARSRVPRGETLLDKINRIENYIFQLPFTNIMISESHDITSLGGHDTTSLGAHDITSLVGHDTATVLGDHDTATVLGDHETTNLGGNGNGNIGAKSPQFQNPNNLIDAKISQISKYIDSEFRRIDGVISNLQANDDNLKKEIIHDIVDMKGLIDSSQETLKSALDQADENLNTTLTLKSHVESLNSNLLRDSKNRIRATLDDLGKMLDNLRDLQSYVEDIYHDTESMESKVRSNDMDFEECGRIEIAIRQARTKSCNYYADSHDSNEVLSNHSKHFSENLSLLKQLQPSSDENDKLSKTFELLNKEIKYILSAILKSLNVSNMKWQLLDDLISDFWKNSMNSPTTMTPHQDLQSINSRTELPDKLEVLILDENISSGNSPTGVSSHSISRGHSPNITIAVDSQQIGSINSSSSTNLPVLEESKQKSSKELNVIEVSTNTSNPSTNRSVLRDALFSNDDLKTHLQSLSRDVIGLVSDTPMSAVDSTIVGDDDEMTVATDTGSRLKIKSGMKKRDNIILRKDEFKPIPSGKRVKSRVPVLQQRTKKIQISQPDSDDDSVDNQTITEGSRVLIIKGPHADKYAIIECEVDANGSEVVTSGGFNRNDYNGKKSNDTYYRVVLDNNEVYVGSPTGYTPAQSPASRKSDRRYRDLMSQSVGPYAETSESLRKEMNTLAEKLNKMLHDQARLQKIEEILTHKADNDELESKAGIDMFKTVENSIREVIDELGDLRKIQSKELKEIQDQLQSSILEAINRELTRQRLEEESNDSLATTKALCLSCGRSTVQRRNSIERPISPFFYNSLNNHSSAGPDVYRGGFKMPVSLPMLSAQDPKDHEGSHQDVKFYSNEHNGIRNEEISDEIKIDLIHSHSIPTKELKRPMTTSANIVKVGEFKNKDDSHNHRNAFTGKKSMRADVIYSSDKFDLPDLSKNITTLLNTKKNNTKKAT